MALVESIVVPLGSKIPAFTLKDPYGKEYKSSEVFGARGLLLVVTCNHCPYALAVWPRVLRLAKCCKDKGINTIAVNPNIHPDYPDDSAEAMKKKIKEWASDFPYLVDETQEVAKSLKAQCTPDIYLYNETQALIYHGRIDDNWKEESKVTKQELKEAIDQHLAKEPIATKQFPTMGCSIKWRD